MQVRWPNAPRVIAAMQYPQAFRNYTAGMSEPPCDMMGGYVTLIFVIAQPKQIARDEQLAVAHAARIDAALPLPTAPRVPHLKRLAKEAFQKEGASIVGGIEKAIALLVAPGPHDAPPFVSVLNARSTSALSRSPFIHL
jgi:hypothetical protein